MVSDNFLRYAPRLNTAVALLSKVDASSNTPRSVGKTFSRARAYVQSARYDVNSFAKYASDLSSYSAFFKSARGPYFTPLRLPYVPFAKRHLLADHLLASSLFGWGPNDDFYLSGLKRSKRSCLFPARSSGSARFVFSYKFLRSRSLGIKGRNKPLRHKFKKRSTLPCSPFRRILLRSKPFVRALRSRVWASFLARRTLSLFAPVRRRARFRRSIFRSLRRGPFSAPALRRLKKFMAQSSVASVLPARSLLFAARHLHNLFLSRRLKFLRRSGAQINNFFFKLFPSGFGRRLKRRSRVNFFYFSKRFSGLFFRSRSRSRRFTGSSGAIVPRARFRSLRFKFSKCKSFFNFSPHISFNTVSFARPPVSVAPQFQAFSNLDRYRYALGVSILRFLQRECRFNSVDSGLLLARLFFFDAHSAYAHALLPHFFNFSLYTLHYVHSTPGRFSKPVTRGRFTNLRVR